MYPLINLNNKKIVIVGASKGIGRQTAITLSSIGAKCILVARSEDALKTVQDELEGSGHGHYMLDVSQIENIEPAVKDIVNEFGAVDGMVYAAGVTNDRPINLLKYEVVEATMKINYFGFVEFVRCLSKKKRYNPGMRVVGISSTASIAGTKAHTVYSSSKAAMDAAVRCLIHELTPKGISLNTVAPSFIKTEMYDRWIDSNEEDGKQIKVMKTIQYLGVGETEDVANAIAFLLCPAARFVNGTCLILDGGGSSN